MRAVVLLVLVLCFESASAEEIFKCRGADGSIVFASKPCGDDAAAVKIRPGPTPVPAARTAAIPPEATPAASPTPPVDDKAADAAARAEADRATAYCWEEVRKVDARMEEVRDYDYARDIAFATPARLEDARERDLAPLRAQRSNLTVECERRWHELYASARYQ
jgi:hypothetical protein